MNSTTHWHDFLFAKIPNEDFAVYSNLPLLGPVYTIILVNIAYLGFVLKIGPRLMRNRQPFELKYVLMAYNATQVIACSFLVFTVTYYLFFTGAYEFGCVLKLPLNHSIKFEEVTIVYVAYLIKYLDYLDTIFFVLRKSYRQLTFLHVYHHLIVSSATYCYIRSYGFGGHGLVAGYFNAVVHVFMYAYYFVAANKPELKKSVWWKRHITEMQIVQFLIIQFHQMWPLFVRTDCGFPKFWHFIIIAQSMWFIYLFGRFYKNSYLSKKRVAHENGFEKATQLSKKVM